MLRLIGFTVDYYLLKAGKQPWWIEETLHRYEVSEAFMDQLYTVLVLR